MDSINEKDISTIHVGTTVTALAYWRKWKGRVVYIQAQLDPTRRTAQARIEVANPGDALRLDMYMDVAFDSQRAKSSAVPESAVQAIGDMQFVFAVRHDEVVTDGSFILKAEAVCEHPEL